MLNLSATLTCPHGATVTAVPAQQQVIVGGDVALTAGDDFIVAGCAFMIGPVPSPCITVLWAQPDTATTAGYNPTLSADSVGMCVAATGAIQGPVTIQAPGQSAVTSK